MSADYVAFYFLEAVGGEGGGGEPKINSGHSI